MSSNNLQHIIGGKKHSGSSGRSLDVFNPATGKVTKTIEAASAKDTAKAIQVASDAFEDWSQVPPSKRAQIMFTYRELIIKHTDELAELVSQENTERLLQMLKVKWEEALRLWSTVLL